MKRLLLLLLPLCFHFLLAGAQHTKADIRNIWASRMGSAYTRAAYFDMESAGELQPGNTSAKVVRKALQLLQEPAHEECIAYTSRKLRQKERKELYEIRGLCYQAQLENEKAIADFKKALVLAPDDTTYQAIFQVYYNDENYQQALQWAKKGLEQYPKSVTLWHAFAYAVEKTAADWHEALPIYDKTAELEGSGRFFNMAGGTCWMKGDYACAVEYMTKAIEVVPNSAFYYSRRGDFYQESLQYEKAIADQLKAVALEPKNAGYWHSLAEAYDANDEAAKRDAALSRSEELGLTDCICYIHYKKNDF